MNVNHDIVRAEPIVKGRFHAVMISIKSLHNVVQ